MPVFKRDVTSLSKSGSAKLKGDVTLSQGSNVTLTQTGNDISIAASGGGGGLSAVVDDPSPQLGGDLDTQGYVITNIGGAVQIEGDDYQNAIVSGGVSADGVIEGGDGDASFPNAGSMQLLGGTPDTDGDGGDVFIQATPGNGTGSDGRIRLTTISNEAVLDTDNLTGNRDISFPNASGTLALTSDLHNAVTLAGEDYLSLSTQQITANPIDLDNLSATGTPSSSTFLRGDNTWATPAGSGDVSKVGTPVNNQVGVWTGDGTLEGDADLTFDTSTNTLATVNIAPSGTVDGRDVSTDGTKLDGIESGADVTDATNVDAAGATMNADTTLAGNGYFLDEDDMASNSATKVPSQQSVKAYVDGQDVGTVDTVVAGTNIDVDATDPANPIVSLETLTLADISDVTASTAEVNILDGVTATTAELNYTDGVTSAIQTQIDGKQPLDSDLTTIAGLTATTDNFIQSKSSAWASRTPAQVAVDLLPFVYPVGCIYFSTNSTNPATSLGFGTWTAFGAGRVPVGFDSGQTEFDTDEETGGAKTQASNVTVATQPTFTVNSHTHTLSNDGQAKITVTGAGNVLTDVTTSASWTSDRRTNATSNASMASFTEGAGLTGATDATSGTATTRTADVALTNNAVNNLQPYITVRMWKRTA